FFLDMLLRMTLLIGAPKANTSQPQIVEGGAVYKCPWKKGDTSCHQFQFDKTGDRPFKDKPNEPVEFKSYQWFGASLRTKDDKILACAPRYHWRTLNRQEREPVGTCFLAVGEKIVEYAPCRSDKSEADGQGFCQGGFSIDLTTGGRVVLGGPGSFYWQGQLISDRVEDIVTMYNPSELITKFPNQIATLVANAVYDDSYLGYSVAVGNFNDDSVEDFVTGIPRGAKSLGYVTILNGETMKSLINVTGEQMASYFGYSVAVTDVNNDGHDDLLVGAPLFMDRSSDGKYREVGQIYVYLQEGTTFKKPQKLTGTEIYARFGTSITGLGDLDQDGFNDVAVGVPYAGENRKGLVYIYNGKISGLSQHPSQILEGQWASDSLPASFGYSMHGAVDIDRNGYPDLIVGAFGVDKAILYRARPVIHVNASLDVTPSVLNLENKTCQHPVTNIKVSCFTVRFCLSAYGKGATQSLDFNIQLQLDKLKQKGAIKRAMFLHNVHSSYEKKMKVENGERKACEELQAFMKDETEFRDKLTHIAIYMEYKLDLKNLTDSNDLQPILNQLTPDNITKEASILLDCGEDNICKPDLKLSVKGDQKQLYIGVDNPLSLTINALNNGEGAYEAELYVILPPQADYVGVVRDNEKLSRLSCAYKVDNQTRTVVCDLGNPMKAGTDLLAGLRFAVQELQDAEAAVTFELQIRSSNTHNAMSEVVSHLVGITVLAQVDIRGVSSPDQLILPINWVQKENPETEEEVGPLVLHAYELRNNGPSTFSKAILDLNWPYRYKENYLLYVMKYTTEGPMNCSSDKIINPLKLKTVGSSENKTSSQPSRLGNQHHRNHRDTSKGIEKLGCGTAECLRIKCQVGRLEKGMGAVLRIQSRMWAETFLKEENKSYSLMASATYSVIEMPYKNFSTELPTGSIGVTTLVSWVNNPETPPVPIWVIILALLAGLLLLGLLIFIMYKVGFFKRVRPPHGDAAEREQLQPEDMNGDGATEA
uniref:Integrin, alpha V n=1 Tax=Callorhinchus milii TaxID=7868 RepID=A0A4W3IZX7_CALMI